MEIDLSKTLATLHGREGAMKIRSPEMRLLFYDVRRYCSPEFLFFGHYTDESLVASIFYHGLGVRRGGSLATTTQFLNDYLFLRPDKFPRLLSWPFFRGEAVTPAPPKPAVVIVSLPPKPPSIAPSEYMCNVIRPTINLPRRDFLREKGFPHFLPRRNVLGAILWDSRRFVRPERGT